MTTSQERTGLALKVERVRSRVRQRPIADAMGVSVSRVAAIEREAVITDATWDRYLAALDTCRTAQTDASAA